MLIHMALITAAAGGLATVMAFSLAFHPAGSERLIVAGVLQLVIMAVILHLIFRPRPRKHLTWPAAMFGAVLVSGLALVAFGSVPHEFITYADSELNWGRRDLIMIELPVLPFDISRMAVRDIIIAGLYTNSFVASLSMWLLWQRRHSMAEERATEREVGGPVPVGTSAYGRPVSRRG